MSSTPVKLFILGATGYIGGSALHGIYHAIPNLQVSALVRSEKDDAPVSKAFGNARIVRGGFDDLDVIEHESVQADFVLNCADADNLDVVKAILKGLKNRPSARDSKPIYLHTSGTSVIASGNDGGLTEEAKTKMWDDNSISDIETIAPSQPHREIDLAIFEANTQGYVDAFIIAPSAIYAEGSGPVKKLSAQIPELIRVAAKRRQAVHIGEGAATWNFVHVEDLEKLYVLVAELALSRKDTNPSFGRFYFGSGESHTWGEVVRRLAPLLHARGKVDSDRVSSVTLKEEPGVTGYFPSTGTNSRSVANRGKALGWMPRAEGVWDELEKDVDGVIAYYNL